MWAQPIADERGAIVKAQDGKPLAVMESVQELTDSAQLRAMPANERLGLVASALHNYCLQDSYLRKRLFHQVRIMVRDASDTFILRATEGFSLQQHIGDSLYISPQHLTCAEDNVKCSGYGYFFPADTAGVYRSAGIPNTGFIYWPILEAGRTVALIEASGKGCSEDTVAAIRPYAQEVLNALYDSRTEVAMAKSRVETSTAKLDIELQNVSSPYDCLRLLVHRGCELTGSSAGHIR